MSTTYGGLILPVAGERITATGVSGVSTNFQKVLNNQAGAIAPTGPVTGQEWYDTGTSTLKLWNGSAWVTTGGGGGGATGATGATGISGYSGVTGATGLSGFSGASTGIPGSTGATGVPGATGLSGFSGYSGIPGATGATPLDLYGYNTTVGQASEIPPNAPASGSFVAPVAVTPIAPNLAGPGPNEYRVNLNSTVDSAAWWRNSAGVWASVTLGSAVSTITVSSGDYITQLARNPVPPVGMGCMGIGP